MKAEHETSLQTVAAGLLINWTFTPSRAPYFGGLWESAIKRAKQHLRKVMGNKVLSFEELTTLFCQIEIIPNSRPICPLSKDANDDTLLTPAHLCLGGKLESMPFKESVGVLRSETINDASDASPVKKWAHLQNLTIHFWKRWTKEYVTSLQERNKWTQETSNLKVGDVVYVTDDNTPLQRPLAKVSYVYSGPDKFVRVVKFKTVNGT